MNTEPDAVVSFLDSLRERRAEQQALTEQTRAARSRGPTIDRPRGADAWALPSGAPDPERFRLDEGTVELGRQRVAEIRQRIDQLRTGRTSA